MKNMYKGLIERKYRLYALIGVAITSPSTLFAQDKGFLRLSDNLNKQMEGIGNIALMGFGLLGLFFVGTGILRLKAAVDSQGQQVKYSEGLWRVGLGGALIAVATITGIANETLLGGAAQGDQTKLGSGFDFKLPSD